MLVESSFFFSSILDFLPVPWHVFSGRWHRERLRHHLHGHSALGIASEAQVDDPAMVFHGIHGYNKVIFHFMGISWNIHQQYWYPLVNVYSLLLKMAIEIVDLPIKHGDCP